MKKYSIEMILEIIVANAAPETSMPKPNGILTAPPKSASPFSKIKIGSRIMFKIPPIERPMPASFVLPTARTRCPSIKPATVGMPPITNTQSRYLAEKLNVNSSALKNVRIGCMNTPRMTASTAVTPMHAQKPKDEAFLAVLSSFLPRLLAITLFAPIPKRFATAVSRVKIGNVIESAASWLGSPICPTKKVSARLYRMTTI